MAMVSTEIHDLVHNETPMVFLQPKYNRSTPLYLTIVSATQETQLKHAFAIDSKDLCDKLIMGVTYNDQS